MQLITRPTISLVAWTEFKCPSHIMDLWTTNSENDGERLIEFAGRNCYSAWKNPSGRTNEEYCANLLDHGHLSVLEHGSATFLLEGVSRSLTHELVRHRHMSFSQLSQRFVADAEGHYVVPPAIQGDPYLEELFADSVALAHRSYQTLLAQLEMKMEQKEDVAGSSHTKKKQVREAARGLLPNCAETKIVVTGNYRAWRHFIRKRAALDADREIRGVAVDILIELKEHVPAAFQDFTLQGSPSDAYAECSHLES